MGGKSHDFSVIFSSHVLANLSKYQFKFFRSKVHNAYAPTYCLAKAHILLEGNKTNVLIYLNINEPQSTALEK